MCRVRLPAPSRKPDRLFQLSFGLEVVAGNNISARRSKYPAWQRGYAYAQTRRAISNIFVNGACTVAARSCRNLRARWGMTVRGIHKIAPAQAEPPCPDGHRLHGLHVIGGGPTVGAASPSCCARGMNGGATGRSDDLSRSTAFIRACPRSPDIPPSPPTRTGISLSSLVLPSSSRLSGSVSPTPCCHRQREPDWPDEAAPPLRGASRHR